MAKVIKQKNKYKKAAETRASRNITLMVMGCCFLYLFGMMPYITVLIMNFLKIDFDFLHILKKITFFFLLLVHGSNIFIYFSFNNLFRLVLKEYFKKICFCSE